MPRPDLARLLACVPCLLAVAPLATAADAPASRPEPLVVSADLTLEPGAVLDRPLVIAADGVVIDGRGATIRGPGKPGERERLVGTGVLIAGRKGVTIRDLSVHGFEIGLEARDSSGLRIEGCDLSDNYHDPGHGWGDGERNGGLILTRVTGSTIVRTKSNRVWNGLDLLESDDNVVERSDLSRCSNVCLKLWRSSRNRFADNDLSWGLRMDPGEVHARDSTCVLIETGSDANVFLRNDITHGGDGVFIRPLNGWVSTGNVFIENDCSYANNNGFESWSPGNTFLRNRANHCSFGFWLGGSDRSVIVGNEASFNGLESGKHNAPEGDFVHGGIVIVGGQGHHTIIDGNRCIGNNGAGIVFRGDVGTRGARWKMENLVVQRNVLEGNRWGVFARFTDGLFLSANEIRDSKDSDELLEDVASLRRGTPDPEGAEPPKAVLVGPSRVRVGETVVLDASRSADPLGRPLEFHWSLGGEKAAGPRVEHAFDRPGFHRVSLVVTNGHLAAPASLDVHASRPVAERGTEGDAARWTAQAEGGREGAPAAATVSDDPEAMVGGRSLRLAAGAGTAAADLVLPLAAGDLAEKERATFWIRSRNANNWGFQGAGPALRLHAGKAAFSYLPARGGLPVNLLRDPPYAEARQGWLWIEVPLAGSADWIRMETWDGAPPPTVDSCLRFETIETPFETRGDCALASTAGLVFCMVRDDDRLWRSPDGRSWSPCSAPAEALGAPGGDWENGAMAPWRSPEGRDLLVLRRREAKRDANGENPPRYVLYDVAGDSWRWTRTYATAGHAYVAAGGSILALSHAVGGNYGGPLVRFDPAADRSYDDRSVPAGLRGNDGRWWFSRAAKLAVLDGTVWGIKNDWVTPAPVSDEAGGDRVFSFEPSDYRASAFRGDKPWAEESWKAAETAVRDLGLAPFEPGHGSALVALPPGWSPDVGARGGLLVVAGCSPSNHEGFGPPSDRFALRDLAAGTWVTGHLPGPTGAGTGATFHGGKLLVKRGGVGHGPSDRQLWIVTGLPRAEADAARAAAEGQRMRLDRVDRASFRLESAGDLPWTVWIDGLGFE